MENNQKKLAEDVLQILYPLRGEWEYAEWLIDAIQKEFFMGDSLIDLANLLIRAAHTVDENERISIFSHMSEFIQQNREKECIDRMEEQTENDTLINSL